MGCIFGSGNMPNPTEENDGGETKSNKGKSKGTNKAKAGQPQTSSVSEGGRPKKMRSPSVVYKIQIEHFISPTQEDQVEVDLRAGAREKSPMKLDYVLQTAGQLYQSPLHPQLLATIIRVAIALYDDCDDRENGQIILQEGFDNANYQMQEDRENGLLPDDDEALDEDNKQLQEIRQLLDIMRTVTWAWSSNDPTPEIQLTAWVREPRPLSVDSFSRPDGMSFGEVSEDEHAAVILAGQVTIEENDPLDKESEQPPPASSSPLSSRELCDLIQSAKTSQNISDDVTDSALRYVESADSIDSQTNDVILEWCEFLRQNEKGDSAVSLEARLREKRDGGNVDS